MIPPQHRVPERVSSSTAALRPTALASKSAIASDAALLGDSVPEITDAQA